MKYEDLSKEIITFSTQFQNEKTSSERAKLQYIGAAAFGRRSYKRGAAAFGRRPPFIGSYIGVLLSQMRSYK